jgi:HAD superfamily hydrolase (TIGR01509 family)
VSCELVIFDCDGVLVDSEPIANREFTAALHELGLDWTYEEVCAQFIGMSMDHCILRIEEELNRSVPPDFVDRLKERTFAAFRAEPLQAVRGIPQLLDRLDVPFCVASSGDVEKMRTTLGMTGLLPYFEGRMFSSTQVERGKPAPDLFLLAAESLRVAARRCVVIEDSVPGVRGAAAAGMRVLGFAARSNGRQLEQAGAVVFDSMARVPDLIRPGK